MRIASRRLGEFLVERHVLSRDVLEALLGRESSEGMHLSELLVRERLVGEHDLVAAVASELGVPFVDLNERTILADVWQLVPEELARGYLAVAVERQPDGVLVAMEDPSDETLLTALADELGATVLPAVAVRSDLEQVIELVYGGDAGNGARRSGHELDHLLRYSVAQGASDLHLSVGSPPAIRVLGALVPLEGAAVLNGSDTRRLVRGALTRRQRERLDERGELATSYSVAGVGRFRVGAFVQRNSLSAVFRAVPHQVPDLGELGLPPVVETLAEARSGLVLVSGAQGAGTSTTVAALVGRINRDRAVHILTIEDPIEFLHQHGRAIVNQREVGEDTDSFADAVRQARRQDPDVLVVSELPDLETIRRVLAAAEAGTLVLASMRCRDTVDAIERLVEGFPVDHQRLVRVQLSTVLRGALVQQLVPDVDDGRAVATEVLIGTHEVRDAIVAADNGKLTALLNARLDQGLQSMDRALAALVKAKRITRETALEYAVERGEVEWLLSSGSSGGLARSGRA
jgi:twitching motility protein PilT